MAELRDRHGPQLICQRKRPTSPRSTSGPIPLSGHPKATNWRGKRKIPTRSDIFKDSPPDTTRNASKSKDIPDVTREQRSRMGSEVDVKRPFSEEEFSDLRARLDRLNLKRAGLRIDRAFRALGEKGRAEEGRYEQIAGVGEIIIRHALNSARTLNHEAIHALRNLGLFTPSEWAVLEDRARNSWAKKYRDHLAQYEDQPPAVRLEEAVAEAFADAMTRPAAPTGRIRTAFRKIDRFMRGAELAERHGLPDLGGRVRAGFERRSGRTAGLVAPDSARRAADGRGAQPENERPARSCQERSGSLEERANPLLAGENP